MVVLSGADLWYGHGDRRRGSVYNFPPVSYKERRTSPPSVSSCPFPSFTSLMKPPNRLPDLLSFVSPGSPPSALTCHCRLSTGRPAAETKRVPGARYSPGGNFPTGAGQQCPSGVVRVELYIVVDIYLCEESVGGKCG